MITKRFANEEERQGWVEVMAHSHQYFDFADINSPKNVIGTLAHYGFDNLFAIEVVNKMKELRKL